SLGAKHERDLYCKLSHRTTAENGYGITRLYVTVQSSLIAGRKNVANKERLLVRHPIGYLQCAHVSKGNANKLCLSSGIATVHLRVSVDSRSRITVELLLQKCMGIGVVAQGVHLLAAIEATSASDWKCHHYPVA